MHYLFLSNNICKSHDIFEYKDFIIVLISHINIWKLLMLFCNEQCKKRLNIMEANNIKECIFLKISVCDFTLYIDEMYNKLLILWWYKIKIKYFDI